MKFHGLGLESKSFAHQYLASVQLVPTYYSKFVRLTHCTKIVNVALQNHNDIAMPERPALGGAGL